MYFYLYKTTNLINGKIYIGVHKSKFKNDNYFGSGRALKDDIKKLGKQNFTKEILEYFHNSKDMFLREKQIINEDFVSRNDTYNLRIGGFGGFDFINQNKLGDRTGYKFSDEQRKIMSESRKAAVTDYHRAEISRRQIGNKYGLGVSGGKLVTCPHCKKIGFQNGMTRWHFDKCKTRV